MSISPVTFIWGVSRKQMTGDRSELLQKVSNKMYDVILWPAHIKNRLKIIKKTRK